MSLLRANSRLGWLSVRQKVQLNTVTMVHKCRTKQAPPYLCNLFHDRFKVTGRNTRNMSQLNLPKKTYLTYLKNQLVNALSPFAGQKNTTSFQETFEAQTIF